MPAVATAVVHTEPASVYLADDIDILHRVLALEVVARTDPSLLNGRAEEIREALLEERWGDAVVVWIRETGTGIDVYTNSSVYSDDDVPDDLIGAQLQFSALFRVGARNPSCHFRHRKVTQCRRQNRNRRSLTPYPKI